MPTAVIKNSPASPQTHPKMQWRPAQGKQLLAPFSHQVAGQSSMLHYDKTTVCKPLISREHFVYKTLPDKLKKFTPEYRGEIEVELQEQDGYIQLYGMCVGRELAENTSCVCSTNEEDSPSPEPARDTPRPESPHSHMREGSDEGQGSETESLALQPSYMVRVLRSGSYEVCSTTENVFYTASSSSDYRHTQSLNPWSLKNHKRLLDKILQSKHSHNRIRFILLKNMVAGYQRPCILDLKIGSRLHGDNASKKKVESQSRKCRETTSSTLGVRLCGMQVYQVDSGLYKSYDKYHGRTLTQESFKSALYEFLHNGDRFRSELLQLIIQRLNQLIVCLQGVSSFRFYASSLLIIYDGEVNDNDIYLDSSSRQDSDVTCLTPNHPMMSQVGGRAGVHSEVPCNNCLVDEDEHDREDDMHVTEGPKGRLKAVSTPPQTQPVSKGTSPYSGHRIRKEHLSGGVASQPVSDVSHWENGNKTVNGKPQLRGRVGDNEVKNISSVSLNCSSVTSESEDVSVCTKPQHSHINSDSIKIVNSSHPNLVRGSGTVDLQSSSGDDNENINGSFFQTHPEKATFSSFDLRNGKNRPQAVQCIVPSHGEDDNSREVIGLDTDSTELTSKKKTLNVKDQDEFYNSAKNYYRSPGTQGKKKSRVQMNVKMIDFAHTTHQGFAMDRKKYIGPDTDYICGLHNLIELFQQLQVEN